MWPHVATSVIGFWLLASPDLLEYAGTARMNNQIVGAWLATFGLIAASESVRALALGQRGTGTWLLVAPFLLGLPGRASLRKPGGRYGRHCAVIDPRPVFRTVRWGMDPHSGKEHRHDDRLVPQESRA
jgi:apolipoprotein N-acyltransferase